MIETKQPVSYSVIWLHGLGADGSDFVGIVKELQLPNIGIRFIFPHAPIRPVSINNMMPMRAWFDIFSLTNLEQIDLQGVQSSKTEIESLIQTEVKNGIPSDHIILAGFSQGGAIALYTGLRYPNPLAGIFALSTYLPLLSTLKDEINPVNQSTPIFIAHGEYDDVLPQQLGEITRNNLRMLQYSVEWHSYPMGHEVCHKEIQDISQWLTKIIKK